MGVALERLGKLDDAIAAQRRAVSLAPALYQPHANLAGLYLTTHRYQDGIRAAQEALRLGEPRLYIQRCSATSITTRSISSGGGLLRGPPRPGSRQCLGPRLAAEDPARRGGALRTPVRTAIRSVGHAWLGHLVLTVACLWALAVHTTYRVPAGPLLLVLPWLGVGVTVLSVLMLLASLLPRADTGMLRACSMDWTAVRSPVPSSSSRPASRRPRCRRHPGSPRRASRSAWWWQRPAWRPSGGGCRRRRQGDRRGAPLDAAARPRRRRRSILGQSRGVLQRRPRRSPPSAQDLEGRRRRGGTRRHGPRRALVPHSQVELALLNLPGPAPSVSSWPRGRKPGCIGRAPSASTCTPGAWASPGSPHPVGRSLRHARQILEVSPAAYHAPKQLTAALVERRQMDEALAVTRRYLELYPATSSRRSSSPGIWRSPGASARRPG